MLSKLRESENENRNQSDMINCDCLGEDFCVFLCIVVAESRKNIATSLINVRGEY